MKDLSEIRTNIDAIDEQIVALYEKRMQLTTKVAEYKIATGKAVLDKERERSKLEALMALVDTPFLKVGVRELFEQIMATSRKKQYQLLAEKEEPFDFGFKQIEKLDTDNIRVVYQGVEGAYAHLALLSYFGKNQAHFHVPTWRDAMEAIKEGQADFAVLPFENSTAGIVAENYDLLREYGFCIIGEITIPINHCLLALPGAALSDIKTIYSHPQALSQCTLFLEKHPQIEIISQKNTAVAAKKVCDDANPSQAAIASRLTSELYGLQILEEEIQNSSSNATRFIIVSRKKEYIAGAGKISICVRLSHASGALYHALSHFIFNGLNLTSIESRPIPDASWEYQFFIDFDGNLTDPAVENALKGLAAEASDFMVFGNY